ncbi:hypothetical protein LCGC14_1423400, partial [marine sediment metagenome]
MYSAEEWARMHGGRTDIRSQAEQNRYILAMNAKRKAAKGQASK